MADNHEERQKKREIKMKRFRGREPSIPGHPRGLLLVSSMYTRIQIDAPSLFFSVKQHRHGTQATSV